MSNQNREKGAGLFEKTLVIERERICTGLAVIAAYFFYRYEWMFLKNPEYFNSLDITIPVGIALMALLAFSRKLLITRILLALTSVLWIWNMVKLSLRYESLSGDLINIIAYSAIILILNLFLNLKKRYEV